MLLHGNLKYSAGSSPFVSTLNFWKMKLSAAEERESESWSVAESVGCLILLRAPV